MGFGCCISGLVGNLTMKTCKRCGRTLQEDQFYTGSSWCKECKKEYVKEYRELHPEQHKENMKRFREQLQPDRIVKERFERDSEGLIKCKQCGMFKTESEFYKTYGVYIRMPCKHCMAENRLIALEE